VAEPLVRRGASVVGVDATARNIAIARRHASQSSLDIDYRHGLTGTLVQSEERFDVVLNLEVVEHVADPEKLLQECAVLVKPGGLLIVATLNRTVRSFLLAIVGAEYVLNWLPKGTHRWSRFMRPNEIRSITETRGLDVSDVTGVSYNPVTDRWRLSTDTSVNYLLLAHKNL
jgi:2-polyprenyl-6-hydroxyphenyl methylase/3-demethylubiquinone-9 3-methyltransferase